MIQLVECPRDAMQGWQKPISTDAKLAYHRQLLKVGFHTIDIGSFVSPKAIPQMADTAEVLAGLAGTATSSKLLVIVANQRGVEQALEQPLVHYLGFPFSLSSTFQQRNTNSTQAAAAELVQAAQAACAIAGKQLVVYLSMGFGNPYGDDYSPALIGQWAHRFADLGVTNLSLADTVGVATPEQVESALLFMHKEFPHVTTSAHLHCTPTNWRDKLKAALAAGCTRVDAALGGAGGCPFAQNELVGNLATEQLVSFCQAEGFALQPLDHDALRQASVMASQIFAP